MNRLLITFRNRCSRSTLLPLRTLNRTTSSPYVRTLRRPSRTCSHRVPRNDVLALQQLLDLVALSPLNSGHLASVLLHATLLPQLDTTRSPVLAHW